MRADIILCVLLLRPHAETLFGGGAEAVGVAGWWRRGVLPWPAAAPGSDVQLAAATATAAGPSSAPASTPRRRPRARRRPARSVRRAPPPRRVDGELHRRRRVDAGRVTGDSSGSRKVRRAVGWGVDDGDLRDVHLTHGSHGGFSSHAMATMEPSFSFATPAAAREETPTPSYGRRAKTRSRIGLGGGGEGEGGGGGRG